MPRQTIHFVLVLTMLLTMSVVGSLALNWISDAGQTQTSWSASAYESERPETVRPGAENPQAHQSETPRRVEAPERHLADFGRQGAPPARRALKTAGREALWHGANGSDSATPRHLRLCVFLC